MIIRQLSVLIEARTGAIAEVLAVLKANGVNLRASSLADTGEFGIFRMVVNDPEKVESLLRDSGFTVRITQVLALTLNDDSGCLFESMVKLKEAGINVEYIYGFAAATSSEARVILKVDNLELAAKLLNEQQLNNLYSNEEDIPDFYW